MQKVSQNPLLQKSIVPVSQRISHLGAFPFGRFFKLFTKKIHVGSSQQDCIGINTLPRNYKIFRIYQPELSILILKKNYHRLYKLDEKKIQAWKEGKTGYPLIDASMRCLVKTGWLNFRMRAMVASFFVYILRQPWQIGADFMHYHLIDADTAINYAQWQMQAGLIGVHPHRIYNPTKQIEDNDAEGLFIKKYVPELKDAPIEFLLKDPCQASLLFQYIPPIVNFEKKAKEIRGLLKDIDRQAKLVLKQPEVFRRASLSTKK